MRDDVFKKRTLLPNLWPDLNIILRNTEGIPVVEVFVFRNLE